MFRGWPLAAALSLLALGASAQDSTTTCQDDGFGQVRCRTQAAPASGLDAYYEARRHYQELDAARQRQAAEARNNQLQARVAGAIRAGRCAEAKDMALAAGRLDLADMAQRLCTPD